MYLQQRVTKTFPGAVRNCIAIRAKLISEHYQSVFYRWTVHSEIHTVHSPTDGHLLGL